MDARIERLEHRIEVLFAAVEVQTAEIAALNRQDAALKTTILPGPPRPAVAALRRVVRAVLGARFHVLIGLAHTVTARHSIGRDLGALARIVRPPIGARHEPEHYNQR